MVGVWMWIAAIGLIAALSFGVVSIGSAANEAAQAQSAADAAALAGAANGTDAVHELAARNGAVVLGIRVDGDVTTVEVRVGEASATAAAKRLLVPIP